jgi:hypothetical protein
MTGAKLHHYVSQFHLRRFADADGKLWVWDKQTDRVFPTLPGRVAAETQFYRLTQYAADGHDPLTMEKQLSKLEGDVAAITGQWLDWLPDMSPLDVVPIPRTNRKIVALYLAVQFLRTLDTREILSVLVGLDRGELVLPAEARELHTELMWDQGQIELLAKRFRRSIWIFARSTTATPYVTSDNPMAFRTADNRQWLRAGILSHGTSLVYPLSPQKMLYCHPPRGKFRALRKFANAASPVVLTDEMVDSENCGQVFMASRFLISNRAQFDIERAFAKTIGKDINTPPSASNRESFPPIAK